MPSAPVSTAGDIEPDWKTIGLDVEGNDAAAVLTRHRTPRTAPTVSTSFTKSSEREHRTQAALRFSAVSNAFASIASCFAAWTARAFASRLALAFASLRRDITGLRPASALNVKDAVVDWP